MREEQDRQRQCREERGAKQERETENGERVGE